MKPFSNRKYEKHIIMEAQRKAVILRNRAFQIHKMLIIYFLWKWANVNL